MMARAPSPRVMETPSTVIISGFVIETYPVMSQVPFASVSDQRGKAVKTSEHERFDELYGRCRTCMGHKSGEHLILCDDCDRAFHMTCLIPILREVPKGEWHCPNCTRDRNHTFHVRATAVATLRNVINDIETRPTLPLKLRLKLLNIPRPVVRFSRVISPAYVFSQPEGNITPPLAPRPVATLPANKRLTRKPRAPDPPPPIVEGQERTRVYKNVIPDSLRRRRKHLSRLASDLAPLAIRLGDANVSNSLRGIQDSLESTGKKRCHDEFVDARTSENSMAKASKRPRIVKHPLYGSGSPNVAYSENLGPSPTAAVGSSRQHSNLANGRRFDEEPDYGSDVELVPVQPRPSL